MTDEQFEIVLKEARRLLEITPGTFWSIENYKGVDLGLGFFIQEYGHEFPLILMYLDEWAIRVRPKLNLVEEILVKQLTDPQCVTVEVILKQEKEDSKKILQKVSIWDALPKLFEETNGNIKVIAQEIGRSEARVRQKVKELKLKRTF